MAPAVTAPSAQAAPGDPFNSADASVFVAQSSGGGPTTLYSSTTDGTGTTTFTAVGPPSGLVYNAIAYSTVDNYIYAISGSSGLGGDGSTIPAGSVIRVGQDGYVTRIGTATHPTPGINVGAFGGDGLFYVMAGGSGQEMLVIDHVTGALVRTVNLSAAPSIADFTYIDGYLWSVRVATGQMVRIDPATGTVTTFAEQVLPLGQGQGAVWTYGNGNLGASTNNDGTVYQIAIADGASATPSFTVVASNSGPPSSLNDGTSSPGIPTDLAIVKTGPAEFIPGTTLTYTLTVTNNGPGSSTGFVVDDSVPSPLTNVATNSAACTVTGNDVTCVSGTLAVGASQEFTITADAPATMSTCVLNTATVLANQTDPEPTNNSSSTPSCPAPQDFGDAPESYSTAAAANGPNHYVTGYDSATSTAPLMLGATIDTESDGQPSAAADGDGADENGVAEPILITRNQASTVSVSATNNTNVDVTLAGWIDLNGDGAFQTAERVTATVPANSGTNSYQLAFPAGTTATDSFARFRIFGEVVADPQPTGSAAGGEAEDYLVTVLDTALSVEKTSDATGDTRGGDTITYTVTVRNTGTGDYTDTTPASMSDDLSAVLDDATFNNDAAVSFSNGSASAPPVLTGTTLAWSGPLKSGEIATITYSAALQPGGDGVVTNTACVPAQEAPDCDPIVNLLPRLTIAKTADTTEVPVNGTVVTYTLVVTNEGPGDFTNTRPGTSSDDLSKVLDDAAYNNDAVATAGTVSFDSGAQKLDWSGALAAGATATVTYSVTYDSTGGDQLLVNVACIPAELALNTDEACDSVQTPAAALQQRKSVDPSSGTPVRAGQSLTYTLHFGNTGKAAATLDEFDDLSKVLDDATLTSGPVSSDPALTAVLNGSRIDIDGSVPVGATYTVSYTVTVKAFEQQGDHVLNNALGADTNCTPDSPLCTINPITPPALPETPAASPLANTGSPAMNALLLVAGLLLAAGVSLRLIRRGKASQEEEGALPLT
ncbi:DUF6923 family protein [Arthrobacter sp.]|uniref:DUF6923 family protein n=1 Tax=Arthrobacter sp. TaxID=1667 RepID=UPI00281256DE|nr:GEVED domain-containing protein [Arthrobacter sp.]